MSSQYFSQSYRQARQRIEALVAGHPKLARHISRSFGESEGAPLSADAWLLRGEADPVYGRRLVILSSGLHGIEGFTGSAIQLGAVDEWLDGEATFDLLVIHAVNPYGFHHKRRNNADNIDLNRNATLPGDTRDNPGYERVKHLFNPGAPLEGRALAQRWLMLRILGQAAWSKQAVKDAFLNGQYTDPTGPFYGGEDLAAEVESVGDWVCELSEGYPAVAHLDLHTGYGKRGEAHLLCHSDEAREAWRELGFSPEAAVGGADYQMSGNLLGYCEHRLKKARPGLTYRPVLVEFGTMGMELAAQLESMRIMIVDNSMGPGRVPSEAYEEMFNPSCPRWRHDVVQQGLLLLRRLSECFGVKQAAGAER